jgi:hypothetical protein
MNPDTNNEVAPTKTTMTPQEINKRIAIACHLGSLNYHGDLNAMHEAEKLIDDWAEYIVHLKCVSNSITYASFNWPILGFDAGALSDITHATAAQRAEAFLRTIGQWEEVK